MWSGVIDRRLVRSFCLVVDFVGNKNVKLTYSGSFISFFIPSSTSSFLFVVVNVEFFLNDQQIVGDDRASYL